MASMQNSETRMSVGDFTFCITDLKMNIISQRQRSLLAIYYIIIQ